MTMERRDFLIAGGLAAAGMASLPAMATPEEADAAIRNITRGKPVRPGRVKLVVPPLVENGNSVTVTVSVESPMTPADHVKAIHLIAEKNPQADIVTFHLNHRAGRAAITTRIRLADSQTVTALAQMNDGSFWLATAKSVVTLAACTEGL
jgi:sulfur-oxidizing protein SoxY